MPAGPNHNSTKKKKDEINPWSVSGLGMELVGAVVGMGLLGWFVDYSANTEPWGVTIGAVLGLIGGGYNFGKKAMALQKRSIASMDASRFRTVIDEDEADAGESTGTGSAGHGAGDAIREGGSLETRKRPSMMDRMFGSEEGEMDEDEDVRFPPDFDGTPTLPNQPPKQPPKQGGGRG